MNRHFWSVLFACALGGLLGALFGIEVARRFAFGQHMWALSALGGGLVAYVAVDFRHFCDGVVSAWKKTIRWRPDALYWKTWLISFAGMLTVCSTLILMFALVEYLTGGTNFSWLGLLFKAFVLLSMLLAGPCALSSSSRKPEMSDEIWLARIQSCTDFGWSALKWCNPVGMVVGLVLLCVKLLSLLPALWQDITNTAVSILPPLKTFFWQAFVNVHSKLRTLCFMDATIGATVGYFCGSPILGAVIGGLLGAINYELVSIRWLKLVPAKR